MKKFSFFLSLGSLGLVLLLGYFSGEAKWSPSFSIANETTRPELAISAASNGTYYLVPVMAKGNVTWSLYGQFLDNNGIKGTRVTVMDKFQCYLSRW